jgi:four helix bundle protein
LGSACELEYHLLLARDLALLPEPEYADLAGLASEVKRMLSGLATSLTADVKLKADG